MRLQSNVQIGSLTVPSSSHIFPLISHGNIISGIIEPAKLCNASVIFPSITPKSPSPLSRLCPADRQYFTVGLHHLTLGVEISGSITLFTNANLRRLGEQCHLIFLYNPFLVYFFSTHLITYLGIVEHDLYSVLEVSCICQPLDV